MTAAELCLRRPMKVLVACECSGVVRDAFAARGHDAWSYASKATCLWLKGLPPLMDTCVLAGGRAARRANQTSSGQNRLGPSPTRARERSRTYPGIAAAMADQWGVA
jgi:hypothetical protein